MPILSLIKLKRRLQDAAPPTMQDWEDLIDSMEYYINQAAQTGDEWEALGAFDPTGDIDMSQSGEYDETPTAPYVQTADITLNFANITNGKNQAVSIQADGSHTFTLGTNANTVTGPLGSLVDGAVLAAGIWDFYLLARGGKVTVNVPQTSPGS